MFSYNVACEFEDEAVMREWLGWLEEEHLAEVCAAGAVKAEVVLFDGDPHRCEVRYHFVSREAFEQYERTDAPRLRQEGLRRFPLGRGLRYSRSTGEVVARVGVGG